MYLDNMGRAWAFFIDVDKTKHDLDDLIAYCDNYFSHAYSYQLGGDYYRFFFSAQHHFRSFRQKLGIVMLNQTVAPGDSITDDTAAFVTKKPVPPQSIMITVNGSRTSITFEHLSPEAVQALGSSLVTQAYAAEAEAAEIAARQMDEDEFRHIVLRWFSPYQVVSRGEMDHVRTYLGAVQEDDDPSSPERVELRQRIERIISEVFMGNGSTGWDNYGLSDLAAFMKFVMEELEIDLMN